MNIADVKACNFTSWYPKFEKTTIHSEILPLPEDVLKYLLDPGTLVIPPGSGAFPTAEHSTKDIDSDFDSDDEIGDGDVCPVAEAPALQEFSEKIRETIKRLGGAVFPKLNWTSPQDAAWMSYTNSLRCTNPGDIYLLLKSSDVVEKDIASPFKDCCDGCDPPNDCEGSTCRSVAPALVLKQWKDINPSTEFRGYVVNRKFIGFCPRDISQHYPCLGQERSSIVGDVTSFWRENIENRFPINNYAFDVIRTGKDKVMLVDFAPLHKSRTRALLFSWEELKINALPPPISLRIDAEGDDVELEICEDMQSLNLHNSVDSNRMMEAQESACGISGDCVDGNDDPEFRYINGETGVQPHETGRYGLPDDIRNFGSAPDHQKLYELLKMNNCDNDDGSSDSDDASEEM